MTGRQRPLGPRRRQVSALADKLTQAYDSVRTLQPRSALGSRLLEASVLRAP